MRRTLLIAWIVSFSAAGSAAHDTWLIADRNMAESGKPVWISFVTGEVFPFGDAATDPDRVADFVDMHGGRRSAVTGFAPQDKGLG